MPFYGLGPIPFGLSKCSSRGSIRQYTTRISTIFADGRNCKQFSRAVTVANLPRVPDGQTRRTSDIFSLGTALVAEKVRGSADYHRKKHHYRGHDRKGGDVHSRARHGSELLRPDGCKAQSVVRVGTAARRAGPGSKAAENRQSKNENQQRYTIESFHG